MQRYYGLQYSDQRADPASARLASVKQFGTSAIPRGDLTLLEWRFKYADPSIWFESDGYDGGAVSPDTEVTATYADLNGDARQDVLVISAWLEKKDQDDPGDDSRHSSLSVYLSGRQWVGSQLKDQLVQARRRQRIPVIMAPRTRPAATTAIAPATLTVTERPISRISPANGSMFIFRIGSRASNTPRRIGCKSRIRRSIAPAASLKIVCATTLDAVNGSDVVLADIDGDGRCGTCCTRRKQ